MRFYKVSDGMQMISVYANHWPPAVFLSQLFSDDAVGSPKRLCESIEFLGKTIHHALVLREIEILLLVKWFGFIFIHLQAEII